MEKKTAFAPPTNDSSCSFPRKSRMMIPRVKVEITDHTSIRA